MSAELRQLTRDTVSDKANSDVISILENALVRARRGDITGIVFIEENEKEMLWSTCGVSDRWKVMGFLQTAIYKLIA